MCHVYRKMFWFLMLIFLACLSDPLLTFKHTGWCLRKEFTDINSCRSIRNSRSHRLPVSVRFLVFQTYPPAERCWYSVISIASKFLHVAYPMLFYSHHVIHYEGQGGPVQANSKPRPEVLALCGRASENLRLDVQHLLSHLKADVNSSIYAATHPKLVQNPS